MKGSICMQGPIISIDISDGSSHFQGFIKNGKKYGKVHKIEHDVNGFQFLLESIQKLKDSTGEEVNVVYEATGVYTAPVQRFLYKNNIRQYEICPLESAKKRKEAIHYKKTDKLDPVAISKAYYERDKELKEWKKSEDIYAWLKDKNRMYEDRMNHLRKYKVSFQNKLSICFPGFLKLFTDGYSDIPMTILKKYPHPDLLKNKKAETVASYIEKNTCHSHSISLRYARKVIEFAAKTYPGCEKDDVEVQDLRLLLNKVIETKMECDEILEEMVKVASTLEEYRLILSIDGIGPNLASRIIAEIGRIEDFKSREALVAYAGLDPQIAQSGNISGNHLSISKRGNKYLRCLLYMAVTCSLRVNKANSINTFYKKKKQQTNLMSLS